MKMDLSARTPQEKVLRLYFGESNLPTPEFIKQAAQRALAEGFTFYTENAGLPSTRQALARYYAEIQGVSLDPFTRIVITASGVQALHVAIRCVLDPGDEAIVLTPAWPNGSAIIQMCHAVVRQVAQPFCGSRYEIDFDALEAAITPRTRLLLYTSPSNPLGWVATEHDQQRLLDFARRHHLWLLADEVYDRIYYAHGPSPKPVPSILKHGEAQDAIIVVQSFSKAWRMTGWRVGWLISRPDLCEKAAQLNEFIVSHAPSFAQRAAETALFEGEQSLKEMLAQLEFNRNFCLQRLSQMKRVRLPKPEGAFYLFPQIEGLADSFEFCRRLLLESKVGLAPGVAFGAGGEGSVRICYASEFSILEEAMDRFEKFLLTW